jgi:hypothetical protein
VSAARRWCGIGNEVFPIPICARGTGAQRLGVDDHSTTPSRQTYNIGVTAMIVMHNIATIRIIVSCVSFT